MVQPLNYIWILDHSGRLLFAIFWWIQYNSAMNSKIKTQYLEGHTVEALYLGQYPVVGTVENSRVAFGGAMHHTLVTKAPIQLPFRSRLHEAGSRLIVEGTEVIRIV